MRKEKNIKKYRNIPIGKNNLNQNIYVDSIENEKNLMNFLYNMYGSRDESLTKEGFEFLKEYYGLNKIAALILEEKKSGIDYHFKNKEDVIEWINKMGSL